MITKHEASGILFFVTILIVKISWPAALGLIGIALLIQRFSLSKKLKNCEAL